MQSLASSGRRRPTATLLLLVVLLLGCAPGPVRPQLPERLAPGTVVYGVVPPLFGDDPLRDVAARLDALQELGADVLLLTPVNTTDDCGGISYSITDYFGVRPDFGGLEALRTLVRQAHHRGLRVMLDFVPNHTAAAHPFYVDLQEKGAASAYFDFYDRDASGRVSHYFDWVGLPNLNWDNPQVAAYMTAAFEYWIRAADIDGFRVDVAWGIRERSPQVWPALIHRLRRIDPDTVMVAEAGARDPYYIENGFDLAYDWTEAPGQWAWQAAFENPGRAGRLLHEAISATRESPHRVLRFLNNNDTGQRFISRYGADMTRVAAVLLHTVPGVPLVYTGDEVGAEYEPYDDPPPIAWDDRHGLRHLYRRLAVLREALPALHSGQCISLPPPDSPSVYAFIRAVDHRNWVLVMLNFGPPAQVTVDLPVPYAHWVAATALVDLLGGEPVRPVENTPGRLRITLDGSSAKLLAPATPERRAP